MDHSSVERISSKENAVGFWSNSLTFPVEVFLLVFFSASSVGAADEGPVGRGSYVGKARFAGEVALRAVFSRQGRFCGDDALRGSSSLPRVCEPRLGGFPAQGHHDEWVCVVDVVNDGEYF